MDTITESMLESSVNVRNSTPLLSLLSSDYRPHTDVVGDVLTLTPEPQNDQLAQFMIIKFWQLSASYC